jgi:hypothetical protein
MVNITKKFDRLYLETEQNTIINAKRGCWVEKDTEVEMISIYTHEEDIAEQDPTICVDNCQIVWLEYTFDGIENDHEDEIRRAEFWALFEETE